MKKVLLAKESLDLFVYLILAIGFFSATQDICTDALRIELVEKKELGEASAVFVIGWRIGAILLSGVATFYLAELYGWQSAYQFIGLSVIFLSIVFLIFLKEPIREIRPPKDIFTEPAEWFKDSFFEPLRDIYQRYKNHLILLLFLIFTYSGYLLFFLAFTGLWENASIYLEDVTNYYKIVRPRFEASNGLLGTDQGRLIGTEWGNSLFKGLYTFGHQSVQNIHVSLFCNNLITFRK